MLLLKKRYHMKPLHLTLVFFLLIAMSCTNENKKVQDNDTTEIIAEDTTFSSTNPKINTTNCYEYIKNRDTATLKIIMEGEELTGNLDYKLFEKDHNTGTIAGEMKGDTIIAEYYFKSEGVSSIREIVLVKKDDGKIYEGTGEMMEKGSKMVFKDRSSLMFNQSLVFSPTNCK